MTKGRIKKHHIDIIFLMTLFLIFTFSAVSVLLMAIDSYKSVTASNERTASARIATSYVREVVHQNDVNGAVSVDKLDGVDCIKIDEGDGYFLYIYAYDGYLRELNASENSGAGLDMGDKIMEIKDMEVSWSMDDSLLCVYVEDSFGSREAVDICVRSHYIEATEGEDINEEQE